MKPCRAAAQRFSIALFSLGIFAISQAALAADKEKDAEEEAPVIEVNAEGTPPGYDKVPMGPTYYLWQEGDVWHLRTKTRKNSHMFHGVIQVKGGVVKKIFNFSGLEAQPKKKKKKGKNLPQDLGHLNDAKNRIEFKFRTSGGEDGFDFQLSDNVTEMKFDLKLDGYEHRERILIGNKGQNPPKPVFSIPLTPEKPTK